MKIKHLQHLNYCLFLKNIKKNAYRYSWINISIICCKICIIADCVKLYMSSTFVIHLKTYIFKIFSANLHWTYTATFFFLVNKTSNALERCCMHKHRKATNTECTYRVGKLVFGNQNQVGAMHNFEPKLLLHLNQTYIYTIQNNNMPFGASLITYAHENYISNIYFKTFHIYMHISRNL